MQQSIERAFREEWSRAVAILTRALGDLELAEDAVQDAFAMALERWPRAGEPRNPGAWIVTAAILAAAVTWGRCSISLTTRSDRLGSGGWPGGWKGMPARAG